MLIGKTFRVYGNAEYCACVCRDAGRHIHRHALAGRGVHPTNQIGDFTRYRAGQACTIKRIHDDRRSVQPIGDRLNVIWH